MKQFQHKKRIRSKIYSKASILILSILLLILVKAVWNIWHKELESRKASEETTAKLAELKTRQEKIKSETTYLKTDLGLEEEIRSKFSVAKNGEEVVVIVPKEEEIVPEEKSWFESGWDKFKSWFN